MFSYSSPQRPVIILTWADGTVSIDDPHYHNVEGSFQGENLAQYLTALNYDSQPEVPTAIYAACTPKRYANSVDSGRCGKLHECRIEKRKQEIDSSDYINIWYDVYALIVPQVLPTHKQFDPKDIQHENLVTTVFVRIDGLA
jgi:hypothetical protein